MQIEILPTRAELGAAAAKIAAAALRAAITKNGAANLIVATGSSQFEVLAALVTEPDIRWDCVTGFHLDEYVGLPITHPASFRGYLWKRFVSRLLLPLAAFHYVNGEAEDPQAECARLGNYIARHPIDIALIGIGENGHLAFNDPPADFETSSPYLVVTLDEACRRQQSDEGWFATLAAVPQRAITMSIQQIMSSAAIICTVPDQRKAAAVGAAVEGPILPAVPASILQRHARCTLMLDTAAASALAPRGGR